MHAGRRDRKRDARRVAEALGGTTRRPAAVAALQDFTFSSASAPRAASPLSGLHIAVAPLEVGPHTRSFQAALGQGAYLWKVRSYVPGDRTQERS